MIRKIALLLLLAAIYVGVSNLDATSAQVVQNIKDKGEKNYYGMILKENKNKNLMKQIKKKIGNEYEINNNFENYELLTFKTKESIKDVKKKIGKYGKIELLSNPSLKRSKVFSDELNEGDETENWGLKKINSTYVNDNLGLTGKGIKVGIIDIGIDTKDNSELRDKVVKRFDCSKKILNLSACKEEGYDEKVEHYHGTHVAGIVASAHYGVASGVKLYDFNISDRSEFAKAGDITEEAYDNAIEQILEMYDKGERIDILNMSLGLGDGPTDEMPEYRKKELELVAQKGILLVAATGNDGEKENAAEIANFPSNSPFVIGVGNIKKDEEIDNSSTHNQYVDVVAPGTDILSTGLEGKSMLDSGTSMSSPHIAGILALYKENYPTFEEKEIENMLYEDAKDLGDTGSDHYYGYGLPTAVPPKHYVIKKDLNLLGNYKFYKFPNSNTSPSQEISLSDSYIATRAKGWDVTKERFEYYYIEGKGWLKLDDAWNGIEKDRVTLKLTSKTLSLYNSTNESDSYKSITINPDRIGVHVSETTKKVSTEDGTQIWYKINLPEYAIEGKWIKGEMIESVPEIKINMDMELGSRNFTFYSNPETKENPVIKYGYFPKATVKAGYKWLDSKRGFQWYKVTIDDLGIKDQWLEVNESEGRVIFTQGLTDKVAGRITEKQNLRYPDYIFRNSSATAEFNPGSYLEYKFEKPVNVDHIYIDSNDINSSGLQLKMFDKDRNELLTKNIQSNNVEERYIDLGKVVPQVSSFRLENLGEEIKLIKDFDLFGDYDKVAFEPKPISIEMELGSRNFIFYDDPQTKSNPVVKYGYFPKAVTTEGFYWLNKVGFRWYKVNIDELGIKDKWVEVNDNEGNYIVDGGILNKYLGRIVDQENTYNAGDLFDDGLNWAGEIRGNGYVTYKFDQPVSINSFYISENDYWKVDDSKLVVEFLDKNDQVVQDYTINKDSYFKEFISLENKAKNVYGFKIKNTGNATHTISEIEFY